MKSGHNDNAHMQGICFVQLYMSEMKITIESRQHDSAHPQWGSSANLWRALILYNRWVHLTTQHRQIMQDHWVNETNRQNFSSFIICRLEQEFACMVMSELQRSKTMIYDCLWILQNIWLFKKYIKFSSLALYTVDSWLKKIGNMKHK